MRASAAYLSINYKLCNEHDITLLDIHVYYARGYINCLVGTNVPRTHESDGINDCDVH